ncbi:MAG: DUF4838 domain-containing protein [Lentisphaerae bacterium]|nr:DUF4838 domain-containing protein [Lentisphaerota bacterium]
MPKKSNDRVFLIKDNEVLFSLFRWPPQNAEAMLGPADELVQYLEKVAGQPIPQYEDGYATSLVLDLDPRCELAAEEFLITAGKNEVRLKARTVQGLFHAVYYFLETAAGVRWLWPGPGGEVAPRLQTVSVPAGIVRRSPDFSWRALQVGGAMYAYKGGGVDLVTTRHALLRLPASYQAEFGLWCRRNRFGGVKVMDGHRWCEIAPPEIYGKSEPDLYALVNGRRDNIFRNGKHDNQPCLSNPRVAELMADYACAQFEADPGLDVCSIALNDGKAGCECSECRKRVVSRHDESHFDRITNEFSKTGRSVITKSVSDLVYRNANQAMRKVARRHPGKKLLVLLYSSFRNAPAREVLDPRIVGQLCMMGNSFWNRNILKSEKRLLDSLSGKVRTLGIYEYYANGVWPELPRLFPELIASTVNMYYRAGARYFASQPSMGFAVNGLNYYLLGRLLWDRSVSVDQVIKDYCLRGFGPAAGHIERYFLEFAERWKQTKSATDLPDAPEARLALTHLYPDPSVSRGIPERAAT